ncbi:MAG: septum formation initiator family protein [Pseudomonadota bacterium]
MDPRFAGASLSALILYFAYHAFAGDQGLGKWSDMQREAADLQDQLVALTAEIEAMERDIARLTPETADPDFIEGLAREKLGYAYPHELILIETEI